MHTDSLLTERPLLLFCTNLIIVVMSMKEWLFSKNLQQEHTLVHEINSSQEEEHIFLHIKLYSTDYCMS